MSALSRAAFSLFLVTSLGGCSQLSRVQWPFQPPPDARQLEADCNKAVKGDVLATILALEEYAVDHDNAYPESDALVASLTQHNYLPENQLPQSPWVKRGLRQSVSVGVAGLAPLLRPAAEHGAPTPEGTLLGPGKEATSGHFDALTYGAIVYDYDAASRVYVIYGIGRKGDQAIVAYSWASNQ